MEAVTVNRPNQMRRPRDDDRRTAALLARLRHRQLELALRGRVVESARYARRAHRLATAGAGNRAA